MILLYHHIFPAAGCRDCPQGPERGELVHTPEQLATHLTRLLSAGFQIVPLGELVSTIARRGWEPWKQVAVTFDDGGEDNYTQALPVLERHGVPATFFVTTAHIQENGVPCSSRRKDVLVNAMIRRAELHEARIPGDFQGKSGPRVTRPSEETKTPPLGQHVLTSAATFSKQALSVEQLRDMQRRGMAIGAHSRTHPNLLQVSEAQARDEIAGSKADLEQALKTPIEFFAYPYGAHHRAVVELVRRAGYSAAFSAGGGAQNTRLGLFWLFRYGLSPGLDTAEDRRAFNPLEGTVRGLYRDLRKRLGYPVLKALKRSARGR